MPGLDYRNFYQRGLRGLRGSLNYRNFYQRGLRGLIGELTLPFPTTYGDRVTKSLGALPAPARNPVPLASITTEGQVIDYARGGYKASINKSKAEPNRAAAWVAAANNYRFVHDLTTSSYRRTGVTSEQVGMWVGHLKGLLASAEAPLKGGASPTPHPPGPNNGVVDPSLPPPTQASLSPWVFIGGGLVLVYLAFQKREKRRNANS